MAPLKIFEQQWQFLLSMLPQGVDLEASVREKGLIKRKRGLQSAAALLRLVLVYGFCGLSLQRTSAWAQTQGVAQLSAPALFRWLKLASSWLGEILIAVLAERARVQLSSHRGLRLRLVDATTVSRPGSTQTDWRLHLGVDLEHLCIDHIELTGPEGGETLTRVPLHPGDVLIGDRGYAHRRGLAAVRQAGGHFLVRLNWQNLPLQDRQGQPIDILHLLRGLKQEFTAGEFLVQTAPCDKHQIAAIPARLVAVRKSAPAAERERQRICRQASRKGRKADPRSLEAAGYTFVLTSLPEGLLGSEQILELYRFRWQIELTFKRLKSLLLLDNVPAQDPQLVQTILAAKLLAALLLEDLTDRFLDFSPWGYRLSTAA